MSRNRIFNTRISITDKFILYFVLVFFFSIFIINGIIYYSAKNALTERTSEQLKFVNIVKKRQIELFFKDRISDIRSISSTINLFDEFKRKPDYLFLKSYLIKSLLNNTYFDGLIIYRLDKKTYTHYTNDSTYTLKHDNFIDKLLFRNTKSDIFISDYLKNDYLERNELYLISRNMIDQDIIFALRVSNNSINKIMLEKNPSEGLGKSGESYLVGNDFLMRSKSRFIDTSLMKVKVNTKSVNEALQNRSNTIITKDYRGIEVLSSFSKLNIPFLNWIIIAELDMDEAYASVTDIRRKIYLISIIICSIIFFIAYLVTRKITQPLKQLNSATKSLIEGNYEQFLTVKTNDEISELTESFNILAGTLKQNQIILEESRLKRFGLSVDAQEKEKERLARELHDGLGQHLIVMKLKLESLDTNRSNTDNVISELKEKIDNTINEIRQISNNLMPAVLSELSLVDAVTNLCTELNSYNKTRINFESNLAVDILDKKKKVYLFRIIQESLNNVIKHSNAAACEVKLLENGNIKLLISDDGKGFEMSDATKGSGNGLYYMKERVLSLHGKINIDTKPDEGTLIIINIPK